MARISTYNKAVPVVAEDKWIGSDSQNQMRTRNFTAQDVANFINKKGGEDQNLRYTYNDTTGYLTGWAWPILYVLLIVSGIGQENRKGKK